MYFAALHLHSLLRWVVLALAVTAVATSAAGWRGGSQRPRGRLAGRFLVIALDLQLLVGLSLYFVFSPITGDILAHPSQLAQQPATSYWILIHPLLAMAAIALAHFGQVLSRRSADPRDADRRATFFFGGALLAVVLATPWPFLSVGRGLMP